MKHITLLFITAIILVLTQKSHAQSGWQQNSYYSEEGQSDIIYGPCYSVLAGYDYYGRPVYNWFQKCQQRNWHSWYGRRGGYFWMCNGYNCSWDYKYEERTWWYFTWYNFTRPC
ncbi:MAG TPA: hypothetical protein VK483_11735 [Chitinophagaceae bacterium]|nr:hypothetical protein [Chitinophagaceae bacterium]